jgi:uncharacterized repeat protein (TIGR01451 family)
MSKRFFSIRLCIFSSIFAVLSSFLLGTNFLIQTVQADGGELTHPAQMNVSFSVITIPSGGVTKLSVIIFNPNDFSLILGSSPAAVTAGALTLPTDLTFANPVDATNTCGGTVTTIGNELSLVGGLVPARTGGSDGFCTITVNVTSLVPGNKIFSINSGVLLAKLNDGKDTDITNGDPANATVQVDEVSPPTISKVFNPNLIFLNGVSVLSVTVRNTSTLYPLTQVNFTDTLPTNIKIASTPLPSDWNSGCGSAALKGPSGAALASGDGSFTLTNGTIAAGGSCTIKVNVTSSVTGVYTNVIPAEAIHTVQGVTNGAAASAPLNVQEVGIRKVFDPEAFVSGGHSKLTITIQNPTASDFTGATLTDTLPVGLTLTSTAVTNQCGGSISATPGDRVITLSGGIIPAPTAENPGGGCTIEAEVTSTTPATYTNVIPAKSLKTDQEATNVVAATANLWVYGPGNGASGSKSFSPDAIAVGGESRLTISVRAPADTDLTGFSISDSLPSGLVVSSSPDASKSTDCSGGTFSPTAGSSLVRYTGGTIAKSKTCSLYVDVTSDIPGTYINTISQANISNNEHRNVGGIFTDTLTVSGMTVSKYFDPPSVTPDGISTLTIKLTNINDQQVNQVSLTDILPGSPSAGVIIAPMPHAVTTCNSMDGSTTLTAAAGTQTISLSNGVIPAKVGTVDGICTISVDVMGKGSNTSYTNRIEVGGASGKVFGSGVTVSNRQAATADLAIGSISIAVVKAFDPVSVFGGASSKLSITLTNPSTVPLSGIAFTDNLPQSTDTSGMRIANPSHADTGTCGGTITAEPGTKTFSFSGGSLGTGASKSCTLTVYVTMNVDGNLTNTIEAGAVTSTNGASNPQKASASLTNSAGARITKYYETPLILSGSGNKSVLVIEITNTSNVALTGLGFLDTFPTGMTVSTTPNASQCNGTVNTTSGSITLSGGSLAEYQTCQVKVEVTAPDSGIYENCIEPGGLKNDQAKTNQSPVCDTLTVNDAPQIAKSFSPNPVAAGDPTVLTFTITNPNDSKGITGIGFTDTLPTGLTLASVPNTNQCGGTVSSTENSITLSGGSLAAGGNCKVVVNVLAAAGNGVLTNPISDDALVTTHGNNSSTADATLTILPLIQEKPYLKQNFSPAAVLPNQSAKLTLILANSSNSPAALSAALTAALPSGVVVASSPNASTTCEGSGAVSAAAGSSSITLPQTRSIPAWNNGHEGTCTVSVDVTASAAGQYTQSFAAGDLKTDQGDSAFGSSAVLNVIAPIQYIPPSVGVSFTPDAVQPNGVSKLSLTLTNVNLSTAALTHAIGASLPVGLVIAPTPNLATSCSGGSGLSGAAGGSAFSMSGGNILSGNCTVSVDVTAAASGSYPVTVAGGALQTSLGNNPNGATATLEVVSTSDFDPVISQSFDPNTVLPGVVSTMTLTLTNPALSFATLTSDLVQVLPAGVVVATVPNASSTCGGAGSITANSGAASITLPTGRTIPAGTGSTPGQCSVTVSVTAAASGKFDSAVAMTSLATDQGTNSNTGTTTLLVSPALPSVPPVIFQGFNPTLVSSRDVSTLTFTLVNPNETASTIAADWVETLPTRLVIAPTPNASTTCTGSASLTAAAGASSLTIPATLSIPAGTGGQPGICTVKVDVVGTIGGSYVNTTGKVTSSNAGDGNTATATLTVVTPPGIEKHFNADTINAGDTATLTFTLTNRNPAPISLTGVAFTDLFPVGLKVAGTPNIQTNGCGSPTFAPVANDTKLTFSGATIAAGGTCTASVDVTGAGGVYQNQSSVVTSSNGGTGNSAADTLTIIGPGLILEKSTTNNGFQASGTIHYNYVLTNHGTVTLYAPFQVADDHIGSPLNTPFTCGSATSLAPGDSLSCSADYSVLGSDVSARTVTNLATATAMTAESGGIQVTSNQSSVTVELAELTLKKSTTTAGYRATGNPVSYSYTLTNTGGVTLYAPFQISDDHIGSPVSTPFTCGSATSLAPGANLTCTAAYTITDPDVTNKSVTNTATATAKDQASGGATVNSNQDSVTVYLISPPVISKAFPAPKVIAVGKTTTLTFTIQNPASNAVPLTGVGFVDNFPTGLVVASPPDANQCGGTVSSTDTSVTLKSGTILPGSFCEVSVEVTGTTTGSKVNTSNAVTSTNGGNGNTATDTLLVVAPPTITKAFSKSSAAMNEVVQMTFTIANPNTASELKDIAFDDAFPAGLEVASTPNVVITGCGGSATMPASGGATSLSFSGGALAANGSCTVRVDVLGSTGGAKVNTTGRISSNEGGLGATSNTVTLNVDIAGLSLDKTVTSSSPYDSVGDTISYSYLITNIGTVTLIGNGANGVFTVTDDKIPTVTCPMTPAGLAPGGTLTCTASSTVTQADLDAGKVVNTATAHGKYGSTDVTSNSDSETVDMTQTPALTLTKTITAGNPYKAASDSISYQYELTNNGNITLDGNGGGGLFTISDNQIGSPKGTAFTCGSATSLAPGDTVTCTATYTVNTTDVSRGYLTNVAEGYGKVTINSTRGNAGDLVTSNQATQTAYVHDLTVTKENNTSDVAILQKPFTWTVTVRSVPTARGIFAAGDTILTDTLPSTATYGSPTYTAGAHITGSVSCSITTNVLKCVANGGPVTIGTDAQEGNFTVTYSATPTSMAELSNTVTVNPNHLSQEIDSTNNASTDTLTVTAPDLVVDKSNDAPSSTVVLGNTFNWTMKVSNNGDAVATFANGQKILTDTLPTGATYPSSVTPTLSGVTGGVNCAIASRILTCTANGAVTIPTGSDRVVVTVLATTTAKGPLANTNPTVDPDTHSAESNESNNSDSDTVTVIAPDLITAKSNDVSNTVHLGSDFHWTVTVTNQGDAPANFADQAVISSDTLPDGPTYAVYGTPSVAGTGSTGNVSCSITVDGSNHNVFSCKANGAVTIGLNGTMSAQVTATPATVGTLTNKASADPGHVITENNESNNDSTNNVVTVIAPDLQVDKSNGVGSKILLGQSYVWSIKVSNKGTADAIFADGATILTDTLPDHATYSGLSTVTNPSHVACNITGSALSCAASGGTVTIPATSGSFTITFTVTPTNDNLKDEPSGKRSLSNTAAVDPGNVVTPESNEANNSDTDQVTVSYVDLTVTKTDGQTTYIPGTNVVYTVVVTNNGTGDATNAVVTDTIPAEIASWAWVCTQQSGGASGCTAVASNFASFSDTVTIPAGDSIQYTVTAVTKSAATASLANTAAVAAPSGVTDINLSDNTATDTADTATPQADLRVTKTDGVGVNTYVPGLTSPTYTIAVTNLGPSDAPGAVLNDTRPSMLSGWSWSCAGGTPAAYHCDGGTASPFSDTIDIPAGATITYTVTTAVIASNETANLVNTVTITAPAGVTDLVSTNNSATDTDSAAPTASLSIVKDDGVTTYIPGDDTSARTYSITIQNPGPSDITSATFSDTKPAQIDQWTWVCTEESGGASGCAGATNSAADFSNTLALPKGAKIIYTVTTPKITAEKTGNLVNTAVLNVTAPYTTTVSDDDTDTPDIRTDLSITKTNASTTFIPGQDDVTYTVVVSNAGPSKAVNAHVADAFNSSAFKNWSWECTTVSSAAKCDAVSDSTANFSDDVDIDPGGSITYTVTAATKSSFVGTLTNTATVAVQAGTTDPTPGNNSDDESDTAAPQVALSITKTDGSSTYTPGSSTTYTITVENAGPSDSVGAQISDALPNEISQWTWTCTPSGGASGCDGVTNSNAAFSDMINLPSGGKMVYTVVSSTKSSVTSDLTNTVSVTRGAGENETYLTDNSDFDTDTPSYLASISVTKSDGVSTYTPGQSHPTYTITIHNAGPSDVVDAEVADTKPTQISSWSWSCGSAPAGYHCDGVSDSATDFSDTVDLPAGATLTYTVTTETIASDQTGDLDNTVEVTSPITAMVSDSDSDTASLAADLSVTKDDGVTSYVAGESILTYTVTVHNAGPSDVTGAVLTDTRPAQVSGWTWACADGTPAGYQCNGGTDEAFTDTVNLPSGASIQYTVTTAKIAADQTGSLTNIAAIAAPAGVTDADNSNNSATDTDAAAPKVDLSVTKDDGITEYIPGVTSPTYTITVHNAGPSNVTGAVVTDAKPGQISQWTWTCEDGAHDDNGCDGVTDSTGDFSDTINLPSGATFTYTVTTQPIGSDKSGDLENTVSIAPPAGVTESSNSNNGATDTDSEAAHAVLSVEKSDGVTEYIPGSSALTYTIKVKNDGPSDVTGAVLTDAKPAQISQWTWTCAPGTPAGYACDGVTDSTADFSDTINIPAGVTITYTVTTPVIASNQSGDLVNKVQVSSPISATVEATDTDTAAPTATLTVTKTDDIAGTPPTVVSTYTAGESQPTYAITVHNSGPSDVTGAVVTDAKPNQISQWTWTCADGAHDDYACDGVTDSTTGFNDTVNLPAGATLTYTVTTAVIASDQTGDLANTVRVTSPISSTVEATDTDTPEPVVDLTVTKTTDTTEFRSGDPVLYELDVNNAGPSDSHSVTLENPLPEKVHYISAEGDGWTCGMEVRTGVETVVCSRTELSATRTAKINLRVRIDPGFTGSTGDTVTVDTPTNEPNKSNNDDAVSLDVNAAPVMEATKTDTLDDQDGDGLLGPGDLLTYTIHLQNVGTQDGSTVVFTDQPSSPATLVAGSVTASGSATVTSGNGPDDTQVSVSIPTILSAGGEVTITFQVRIDSPIADGVTQVSNQGQVSGNNFTTLATDDPDTGTVNDPTITPVVTPNVSAVKTVALNNDVNGNGAINPSDSIKYTIVVRNTGDAPATNLLLDDNLDPNTKLQVGSVTTDRGTVVLGNSAGNTKVQVNIGALAKNQTATITYVTRINDAPLPPGVTTISNQAFVSGPNIQTASTDDPGTSTPKDPTSLVVGDPTAVTLISFRAEALPESGQVRLWWVTATEINNAGFNLYRAPVNDFSQAQLINFTPSNSAGPNSGETNYEYLDTPGDGNTWYYWLEDVDTNGTRIIHNQDPVFVFTGDLGNRVFLPIIVK